MEKDNATLNFDEFLKDNSDDFFYIEELDKKLDIELEEYFDELEFIKEETEKIGNPDSLGKVVLDEIWRQFGNQIGLDLTNETLIQKYEREHLGETYDDVGKKVMQDKKYKDSNKSMKEKHESGNLKDEYTGKIMTKDDNPNLDHVVSRKEIFYNDRRKQAGIETEKLANKDENLKPTNESLNKSKGAKSIKEYTDKDKRAQREKDLITQKNKNDIKIESSNKSDLEKKQAKKKNEKKFQDKINADDDLMKKADKEARNAINKDIAKGVVKETANKAAKDAMKQMLITALFSLLKDIMNGLVRFLKNKSKSFKNFLEEMKKSIKSFFKNIKSILKSGVSSAVGTIVNEIFGPILRTFERLSSIIKQGISSLMEAIDYLRKEENKNKSFSVKIAHVGKIITAGVVAGGAIFLGELFEKILMAVPWMNINVPMLGSLSNIIGMFLASIISGIIGAIIINRIDKFISKKQKSYVQELSIKKGNNIIYKQHQKQAVEKLFLDNCKLHTKNNISKRHKEVTEIMKTSYANIMEDFVSDFSDKYYPSIIDDKTIEINKKISKSSVDLDDIISSLKK